MLQQTILDRHTLGQIAWRGLTEINATLLLGLVEHKYSSQPFFLFQNILRTRKSLEVTANWQTPDPRIIL